MDSYKEDNIQEDLSEKLHQMLVKSIKDYESSAEEQYQKALQIQDDSPEYKMYLEFRSKIRQESKELYAAIITGDMDLFDEKLFGFAESADGSRRLLEKIVTKNLNR